MTKKEKKIALFPTISNPPTFGVILSLRYVERYFDKIYVVVRDKPLMMQTKKVVVDLQWALDRDKKKYTVMSSKANFEELTELPEDIPKFNTLITTSERILSNFAEKGYKNLRMIPRPIGWDETFHRVAYHRSVVLEKIKESVANIADLKE